MGIHPKIGITGLPRAGKSAVLEKVVNMLSDERRQEKRSRRDDTAGNPIVGGMKTRVVLEEGQRVGFECVDIITGESAVMAHRDIDFQNNQILQLHQFLLHHYQVQEFFSRIRS